MQEALAALVEGVQLVHPGGMGTMVLLESLVMLVPQVSLEVLDALEDQALTASQDQMVQLVHLGHPEFLVVLELVVELVSLVETETMAHLVAQDLKALVGHLEDPEPLDSQVS